MAYRLPSILPSVVRVRRLSRGLRSAVRRPYSFIRCPIRWRFALPTGSKACPAVCRPPSLFVYSLPHSLTVCPPTGSKACPAVCRPPSLFVYSFPIRWRSAPPTG